MNAGMHVQQGDICQLEVDVIVNAANAELAGGGGVDGAIHRAAGFEQLRQACREIGTCPTGQVRATPAFALPAKAIFHAVGPVWQGGSQGEEHKLSSCYRHCMEMLLEQGYESIAFPAISCGVYQFPPQRASAIAVQTVAPFVEAHGHLKVVFCCFDAAMSGLYRTLLEQRAALH